MGAIVVSIRSGWYRNGKLRIDDAMRDDRGRVHVLFEYRGFGVEMPIAMNTPG